MKNTTIEEVLAAVEGFNINKGPKLDFFINTVHNSDMYATKNKISRSYQLMLEDWQTDFKTLEEVNEFLLIWEKVKRYDWL